MKAYDPELTARIAQVRYKIRQCKGYAHTLRNQYPDESVLTSIMGLLQSVENKLTRRLKEEQDYVQQRKKHLD